MDWDLHASDITYSALPLPPPRHRLAPLHLTVGQHRALSVLAPTLWDALPGDVKLTIPSYIFPSQGKTEKCRLVLICFSLDLSKLLARTLPIFVELFAHVTVKEGGKSPSSNR